MLWCWSFAKWNLIRETAGSSLGTPFQFPIGERRQHGSIQNHPSGQAFEAPHIGRRLPTRLNTRRWHVLRNAFASDQQPETYEAVVAAKTVTPNAIKKLLAKAWCARQIMWPNRQIGILVETGATGFYLVTPGDEQQ
jgi:hypothetical protein